MFVNSFLSIKKEKEKKRWQMMTNMVKAWNEVLSTFHGKEKDQNGLLETIHSL